MTNSPLMYGLIKLHRQIESEAKRHRKNLAHVRAVIEIVSPGFDISTIRPTKAYRPNPWFEQGFLILEALAVLRTAEKPLSLTEIATRMLAKKGITNPTPDNRRDMRNAIRGTLNKYEGRAVKSEGWRKARRWSAK